MNRPPSAGMQLPPPVFLKCGTPDVAPSGTKVALHDLSGAVEDTVIVYDFPFVNAVTIRLPGPDA